MHTRNTTAMKKNLILFNPSSGQNRSINYKKQLEAALDKKNVLHELVVTESEEHLRSLVKKHLSKKNVSQWQSVSAAGGDSTFTILINEMVLAKASLPAGIIPLGSSDDIARELGIYSIDDAVSAICACRFQKMDLGKISGRPSGKTTGRENFTYYFPGQANVGIGVFTNLYVARFQKKFPGQDDTNPAGMAEKCLSRLFKKNQTVAGILGMYQAFKKKAIPSSFTIGYKELSSSKKSSKIIVIEDEFVSILFSKIRFWATGRLFLPEAKIHDGRIHLLMIRKCGFSRTLQIMLGAGRGRHIDQKEVQYVSSDKFQLTSKRSFMIQVDGDIIRKPGKENQKSKEIEFTSITVEALPGRINVLTGQV